MATRLPLPSLAVEGYRAIRELRIAKLGQVNLFVGKNNVGKTSLLEAIRLYVSRNAPTVLSQLFAEKSSRSSSFSRRNAQLASEEFEAIAAEAEGFFYGSFSRNPLSAIRIGPAGMKRDVLEITLPWADAIQRNGGNEKLRTDFFVGAESPVLKIRQGDQQVMIPFDLLLRRIPLWPSRDRTKALMIPATGWRTEQIAQLWDVAAERGMATEVERALRSIQPDLERIYLIGESGLPGRSVRLGISGTSRPVPLHNMGDGINRVFGIALALVQAQDGVLLIDEVENGLHYTIQEEVWRAILLLARNLKVQVFATTHSWDCIQAFAAASNGSVEVDGMLHRLERKKDDSVRTVDLNEGDLAVVTRQHIEVR
jgi:ABC-type branched-subunit amino acid transport system ATPase component